MAKRIVAFVGSRDLPVLFRTSIALVVKYEVGRGSAIWTGDCRTGVDAWVRWYAEGLGAELRVFEPRKEDIQALGYRAALAMRAERIADELEAERQKGADVLIRAWSRPYRGDRPTPGTARTTNRAKRHGLPVLIELRGEAREASGG